MNAKRRLLSTILLISFICTILVPTPVNATSSSSETSTPSSKLPKAPSVVAESAIIMEASTGMILYSKNIHEELYPASITKIMTTLLAVENCSLSETVTFSKEAVFSIEPGSSHAGADVGEEMTMEQALYCIMLASANEVSNAVGEHIAGSLDAFAEMMTARAKELGCQNTHFANANGLHNDNHYTSAYDMALITQAAMKNPTFRTIAGTKRYTIPPTNKQSDTRYLTNHHQMIYPNKYPQYAYEYAIAGKTGYTMKAGNTLVTVAKKDGLELICVVMKSKAASQPENQYTDTISLLDYGFANYTSYNMDNQNVTPTIDESLLFTRYNSLFNSAEAPIRISGDNTVILPNTASLDDVVQTITYYDDVTLQEGDNIIGTITYTLGDTTVGSSNIIFTKKETNKLTTSTHVIQKNDPSKSLANLLNLNSSGMSQPIKILAIILIIILILFVVLFFLNRYKQIQRKRRRNSRRARNLHDKFMGHY